MDIDDRISTVKSLIAKREEIDAQLEALFRGQGVQRRQQKCSRCGQAGHRADSCPQNESSPDSMSTQANEDPALGGVGD